jgi:methionyl-tRNA formyltransferase
MHRLKCYLAGQKYFGQEVLKMLLNMDGLDVVGVSAPFHPDGDKDRLWRYAVQKNIPCKPSGRLGAMDLPEGIDLIIAAHCHDFISAQALAKTRLGAIGYHPSLLPRHRGRDAVYWTIHTSDPVAGGTVYWLNEKVDGGPVAAQSHCLVKPGETPFELWINKLQPLGLALINKVIRDIQGGIIIAVPQDEGLTTWEPSFGRAPLFRPDLPLIGPAPDGFKVIVTANSLH